MGHDHDDEHDARTHGSAPLTGVDPAPLHALVDELAQVLHAYVGTAVGVRAEFGASEADEDPRVLALEQRVGSLNARLYDLLHERLGLHPDLTGMAWDDGEDDEDGGPVAGDVETFHLGFVVGPPPADRTYDSALDLVDAGGAEIAERLAQAGFAVSEWGTARGGPVAFGDDDDEDEDDER
nr:hypothetical protein [Cellulomonas endophytica]